MPSLGSSRPARMFKTVVLPQPEWPITQANSPRAIDSHRFSNTAILPPSAPGDRKSTRLNSSHDQISYAVFCLKKKKKIYYFQNKKKKKKKKQKQNTETTKN